MADAPLHPLRRETGVYPLLRWLHIWCKPILLKRAQRIWTRLGKFLHNPAIGWALCHCRLSFLFLRNGRTSTKFSESSVPFPDGKGTPLLSEVFFLQSDIRCSFNVLKDSLVHRRGRRILALFQRLLSLIFAGYGSCFQFVSEERNEVCTDNLPVLWNRMLI
jgi:hypothetical protein